MPTPLPLSSAIPTTSVAIHHLIITPHTTESETMKEEQISTPEQEAQKQQEEIKPDEAAADAPAAESAAEATEGDEEAKATAEEENETIKALVNELKEARQAADEARDHALRAQAELQNYRRRKDRETNERIAQANAALILELLPVIDDFERAFDNVPEGLNPEEAAWVEGFSLILRKLQAVLERQGVTPIEATGPFDPNLHEAISMEPSDEVKSGEIIAEVRKGYKLNDKVLRPSFVRVAQ